MIRRDFILETPNRLALWYWPVFFWNLAILKRYIEARKAEGGDGMVGYAVSRTGRIYITLDVRGDRPDPNDWTRFAPRAPWEKLDPEAGCTALIAFCGAARSRTCELELAQAVLAGPATQTCQLTTQFDGPLHILGPP